MDFNPSINGIFSSAKTYTDNSHSGLETERRVRPIVSRPTLEPESRVATNNPTPSTPSPRGHA